MMADELWWEIDGKTVLLPREQWPYQPRRLGVITSITAEAKAMTEEELQAIEALATLAATDEDSAYKGLVTRDVPALVAEVRRYRDFVVVNWGDSPIAKFIAACDELQVIAKNLRFDGFRAAANQIERNVSVIKQYHDLKNDTMTP